MAKKRILVSRLMQRSPCLLWGKMLHLMSPHRCLISTAGYQRSGPCSYSESTRKQPALTPFFPRPKALMTTVLTVNRSFTAKHKHSSLFLPCKKATTLVFAVLFSLTMAVPAWSYQEIKVVAGGTIKGKVFYQGFISMRTILPTKDKEVCGGIRKEPRIRVNADKSVQDAVVFLKKVSKGKAWGKKPATPSIDNQKCRFVPHVQVIRSGNIEIINSDPVLHNTHGFYGRRTAFNLALPNQHQRIKKPLRRPGQVRIECDAHGWMLAWVHVADSPYYALTKEDGTFMIENIPPGRYTLVATQSYAGSVEIPVTVKANKAHSISIELKK